jgi:uncharacterized protein (TIGR02646 family)
MAPAMTALVQVTLAEQALMRTAGAADANYWNQQPAADRSSFARFKSEVKEYYLFTQGMRCCYCSFELANDQSTFDAEHILDKSTHRQFMFELNNLAASCRPCNRAKNAKNVLVAALMPGAVPTASADYMIVHPHLDPWGAYLEFDDFGRIRPHGGSPKGADTIEICKIATLNAARLCRQFAAGSKSAEGLLRQFFKYKRLSKKRACLALLRGLADDFGLAKASVIVDRLEQELDGVVVP